MKVDETDLSTVFRRQMPIYGEAGQRKLRDTTILVIGVGGLGSTVATVLSRSGVGKLVLADCDTVAIHNLHRQFLYVASDIDKSKAECAAVSPQLSLSENIVVTVRLDTDGIIELIDRYHVDLVVDCVDGFATRRAANRACVVKRVPFFYTAVTGLQAQLTVFRNDGSDPCLECIFPEPLQDRGPPPVAPAICAVAGALEAEQILAFLTDSGKVLRGELLTIDLSRLVLHTFRLRDKRADCRCCGSAAGSRPNSSSIPLSE